MNWVIFLWKMFWIRREYMQRLDRITEERFVHCKYGTMHKQRKIAHEWYANQFNVLYAQYCK